MSIFARILIPVDGSPQSERAIDLALDVARTCGGDLTFCHVVDRSRIAIETSNIPFADPTPLLDDACAEGERLLANAAGRATALGLSVRTALSDGAPVDAILKLAHDEGCDLIVMGSHGRRGLERFVVGSTTEGVMRESDVPVLVVRVVKEKQKVKAAVSGRVAAAVPTPG
jgi:nucleotide-binding universal stress UspA family protein